jgi:hypothetical protein
MGVIKRGILGGFQNKVGNIVGSSWKGIDTIKSLPISVANPRTAAQIAQRGAFTGVIDLGSAMLTEFIKPLWDRFAQKMSGYNAFVKANIACWTGTVFTGYTDFLLSRGSLTGFVSLTAVADASNQAITVEWTDNSGTGSAQALDEVYVVAYNVTQAIWYTTSDTSTREAATIEVQFEVPIVTGNVLKIYIAARRSDGTMVSTSQLVATTVVA